jgi:hypothetical protein
MNQKMELKYVVVFSQVSKKNGVKNTLILDHVWSHARIENMREWTNPVGKRG